MALLLTSVFGVTGCGSDDDVDLESRVKNIAPEASAVSDALSESDCDSLYDFVELRALRPLIDRIELDLRALNDGLNGLETFNLDAIDGNLDGNLIGSLAYVEQLKLVDSSDFNDIFDRIVDALGLRDRLDLKNLKDLLNDQCVAASDSGTDSVTTTTEPPASATEPEPPAPATEPEGDDVDGG